MMLALGCLFVVFVDVLYPMWGAPFQVQFAESVYQERVFSSVARFLHLPGDHAWLPLISARVVSHSLRPFSVSLDSRCQYLRPLFVCVDSGQGSAASCHSFDFGGQVVLASLARGGKCSLK